MNNKWLAEVVENRGINCPNCGIEWRLLKPETQPDGTSYHNATAAGPAKVIQKCSECGDEAFDIYEATEDMP